MRECQKIAKELLANPAVRKAKAPEAERIKNIYSMMMKPSPAEAPTEEKTKETESSFVKMEPKMEVAALTSAITTGQIQAAAEGAIIGGGGCVHLSVEYMPSQLISNLLSLVAIWVVDSEGTVLGWGKIVQPGYHIKEGIISTNPGAQLELVVLNAIARVRWCEIFSC